MPSGIVPLTSFVGREREIAEVTELLGRARLVSLTGAGGTGKTRLAAEVMAAARGGFPDGAAWVDLAGLAEPGLLWQRVAGAVGVRAQGGRDHRHALAEGLATRRLLLVLDNCEHLVDRVAELVHELLTACAGVRVLLTSREALGVPGEHAWHVPPLSLPDEGATSVEQLLGSEGGRLFVERARAARSEFQLTDAAVPAVVRICRRLDGIPLALELAAARIRVLSPEQISERLDDAFRLLTEGGRTTIPRHRTLRAAIDWSYDLLSEDEALFLLRLSVFRGPFSLSAAEEVCAEPGADGTSDPYRVLDLVERLVERSLVEVQEARGSVVYRLLETVRQYAEARLNEAGGVNELRERHARFFLARVHEAEPFLTGVHRREWVDRLGRDLDNLRQVLAWSRDHDPEMYMEVAGALCWFWFSSRFWAEGRRWLEGALRLSDPSDRSVRRGRILFAAGVLACLQGRPREATAYLEESVAIARESGDARSEAYALNYLGMALIQEGKPEGEAPIRAAMAWFREAEELYGLRLALLLQASLAMARGRQEEAAAFAREGVEVARAFGQDRELGVALHVLGVVAFEEDGHDRALELLRESLECFRRDPFDLFIARSLELVGSIESLRGDHAGALRLIGAADGIRAGLEADLFGIDRARLEPGLEAAREALGEAEVRRLRDEGRRLGPDRVLELARAPAPSREGPASVGGDPVAAGQAPASAGKEVGPEATAPANVVAAREVPHFVVPALEVAALGPLVIVREGVELGPEAWRLQKTRELLVYLLCHPKGRTREEIGAAFWPDASAAQSKNSFHVTLHHLRKALGGNDRVVIDGDRYRINPQLKVRFDVAEFEELVGRLGRGGRERDGGGRHEGNGAPISPEDLERAVALYRGAFLDEERAGEWHLELRDRLEALYVEALLVLARSHLAEERLFECGEAARLVVRTDDLREEGHRLLMTSLARTGRVDEALRHYHHLEVFLREELESEPEPETRRLADELRSGVLSRG